MKTLLVLVAAAVVALSGLAWAQTPAATISVQDSRFTERFRQADANGDGFISEQEARAAGLWFGRDFKGVDTDHNGTVTLFEFVQALQQRLSGWLSDFDAADSNHDGQLTEDEVRRSPGMTETFKRIARDKEHVVSRPEYESYAIERMYRDAELPSVAPNIIEKRF